MSKIKLYKTYIVTFGFVVSSIVFTSNIYAQGIKWFDDVSKYYGNTDTIGTENILNTADLDDPLRAGAKDLGPNSIDGISDDKSTDWEGNRDNVLKAIQKVVNYVLGFLAMISLILIIYNGFILLLSPKDDNVKKAKDTTIKIIRAIGGIGVSWLVISSIFWIIARFT